MSPEEAATYMGLSSPDALIKRTERRQVPAYRIGSRLLRYRAIEIDKALSESRLTTEDHDLPFRDSACLPQGKEANNDRR
jgi:hypothetical protein